MKNAIPEAVEPDIEIVIRTYNIESAVIGIFDAGGSEWDVVVGINEVNTRDGIQSALQLALDAISRATFVEARTLRG